MRKHALGGESPSAVSCLIRRLACPMHALATVRDVLSVNLSVAGARGLGSVGCWEDREGKRRVQEHRSGSSLGRCGDTSVGPERGSALQVLGASLPGEERRVYLGSRD